MVKMLLESGANADVQDNVGTYCISIIGDVHVMHAACEYVHFHCRMLSEQVGRTALYFAAHQGHRAIVKMLLNYGANANIKYKVG